MSPAPPRRAALLFIFFTVLLDMLAFGMIVPVLPKLIERFMDGDAGKAAQVYGLFGTVWALMQLVSMPVLGSLGDAYGRRKVILMSVTGLGLDFILMALAPDLRWLLVGRIISGITSANMSTSSAYIADVTPPEQRSGAYGLMGAAFGVGFVLGPAVGGLLGAVHPRAPFWVAAVLCLLNAVYGLFVLPESLPPERRTPFQWRRANPLAALSMLAQRPELRPLASVKFLTDVAHVALPSTFVLCASYKFKWTESQVGLLMAGVGLSSMVVQAGLVGRAVRRFGERITLPVGLLAGAVSMGLYGLSTTPALFLVGVPLGALQGLAGPSLQSLLTRRVSASEQGRLQGALSSAQGIAGLVGPAMFTQTFAWFIRDDAPMHLPGAAFLLAGVFLVGAASLAVGAARAPSPASS